MKRIFTQKVAMVATKEQQDYLRTELGKLGYDARWLWPNCDCYPIIFLPYTEPGFVGNTTIDFNHDCELVNNIDLFLALAAMSEGPEFWPGEWVVNKDEGLPIEERGLCKFKEYVHGVKRIESNGETFKVFTDSFRKATRDEIIAHFTKPVVVEAVPAEVKLNPIGIMPRWRWLELRAMELKAAIDRYDKANVLIPDEWVSESNSLFDELHSIGKVPTFSSEEAYIELAKHLKVPFVHITD